MFNEKTLAKDKSSRDKWTEQCDQMYEVEGVKTDAKTGSGILLEPVYTLEHLKNMNYEDIGMPGQHPYTRGNFPLGYQYRSWVPTQLFGFGLPEHTRERMKFVKMQGGAEWQPGIDSYGLACCAPLQLGYDPDEPEARGRNGQGGVSMATMRDFEILFDGIDLSKTYINWILLNSTMPVVAMEIAYAERQGIRPEQLMGCGQHLYYASWYDNCATFPPKNTFKLMAEFIKYTSRNMPKWNHTNIDEYCIRESGATLVQSLAFGLATWIAITEECVKAGLEPDDFMDRYIWHLTIGMDFFEEIARTRALRRMWAKICEKRFGCKNPRSFRLRMFQETQAGDLTYQQPLNNIVRVTTQVLGAALAGATTIEPCPYDEVFGLPTEEAQTVAIRTGQIIADETGTAKVCDPLAGSYYVEWLTNKVEEEAYKILEIVEDRGYTECWETGWFKTQLTRSSNDRLDRIARGEDAVIGLNKYVSSEGRTVEGIRAFEYPEGMEETAVERVRRYRAERNNAKTKSALAGLRQEAVRMDRDGGSDLMPAMIEAARVDATIGEMMGVLREVFGWSWLGIT